MTLPANLRPEKRAAILSGARTVFGRLGYARASIDAIAAAAEVSTRTIYKHFANKEELFATVLEASATEVADAFAARARTGVAAARTTEERLLALGHAIASQHLAHPEHFAMVRQISHERDHFPDGVLTAWKEAGPDRVEHEVRAQLRALHDAGELVIEDEARAATHLFALTLAEINQRRLDGPARLTDDEADASIAAGIRVFLRGYAS
jgi:AcrR family transcriptional regulator